MDMSYFNYCQGLTMTSNKFDALFGGEPRKPDSAITQRDMDIAAPIQKVTGRGSCCAPRGTCTRSLG